MLCVVCTVRGTNFDSRDVVTLKYEFCSFFFTVLNFVFCLKWTDVNKLNELQNMPFKTSCSTFSVLFPSVPFRKDNT